MGEYTIRVAPEVLAAADAYRVDHPDHGELPDIAELALRDFLELEGYLPARRRLRIAPAPFGGGDPKASEEHDRVFAEEWT